MTYKYASFLSLQFVVSVYQELGIRARFGCETSVKVDKKKEPSVVSTPLSEDWRQQMYEKVKGFKELYKIWMLGRILSSKDQFLPTFSGWCVAIQTGKLGDNKIEKTSLTYLPPVNHPITDFATI